MVKNRIILKQFNYYLLVIIGLVMFLVYIFIIFFRKRLPKVIPFMLTEYTFWLLVSICFIYIFLIKQILHPTVIKNNAIKTLLYYFAKPFTYFDSFLKYNKLLFSHYNKLLTHITLKLDNWIEIDYILFTYIFQLLPRILLLMIFAVDVFIVGNIQIFYLFIPLALLPLLYRYFIYSITFAISQYISSIEDTYNDVWILEENWGDPDWEHNEKAIYHDKTVSIKEYIRIQQETISNYNEKERNFEYRGRPFAKNEIYTKYRNERKLPITYDLTSEDYDNIHNKFNNLMPEIIKLTFFIENNKMINENNYIPTIKGLIFGIYLICWGYILIISFKTLKDFNISLSILEIINKYYAIEEPFTGLHNDNINIHINISFMLYSLMLLMITLYKFKFLLLIILYKLNIFSQNKIQQEKNKTKKQVKDEVD